MDILASLWSYDNRWLFEYKFSKIGWVIGCIFQLVIFITTVVMGCLPNEIPIWIGFRIMISLGSFLCCFILALRVESQKSDSNKLWAFFKFALPILGTINMLLTWNICYYKHQSLYFEMLANLQIILYSCALVPALVTFVGCCIIKVGFLVVTIVSPRALIKIRKN